MLQHLLPAFRRCVFLATPRPGRRLSEAVEAGQRSPSLPAGGRLLVAGSGAVVICLILSHWPQSLCPSVFLLFVSSQRGSWLPREASIHLLLATPQSTIPRDMSLDVNVNPRKLLLRITHPLKTILVQGQHHRSHITRTGWVLKLSIFFFYFFKDILCSRRISSQGRWS